MKKIIAVFAFLGLLSCSSDDDSDHQPAITTSGSNTAAYTFDGTSVSSLDCEEYIFTALVIQDSQRIEISIDSETGHSSLVIISRTQLEEGKTYRVNSFLNTNIVAYVSNYQGSYILNGSTNTDIGGTLTVEKIDFTNKIIAARFSFDVADNKGEIYSLRNGWFDLKF